MKKYILWLSLICCLIFSGCGTKTTINDTQCKALLDWLISENPDTTTPYKTKNYNFDVFYSKEYNTCISTFSRDVENGSDPLPSWFYIFDEFDNENFCVLAWYDSYKVGLVDCHWKLGKAIKNRDKINLWSKWELENLYSDVINSLK